MFRKSVFLRVHRMAKRKPIPTYRFHQKTGRAVISVYHVDGSRHDILLPVEVRFQREPRGVGAHPC